MKKINIICNSREALHVIQQEKQFLCEEDIFEDYILDIVCECGEDFEDEY